VLFCFVFFCFSSRSVLSTARGNYLDAGALLELKSRELDLEVVLAALVAIRLLDVGEGLLAEVAVLRPVSQPFGVALVLAAGEVLPVYGDAAAADLANATLAPCGLGSGSCARVLRSPECDELDGRLAASSLVWVAARDADAGAWGVGGLGERGRH
jgi:hypothetical protein